MSSTSATEALSMRFRRRRDTRSGTGGIFFEADVAKASPVGSYGPSCSGATLTPITDGPYSGPVIRLRSTTEFIPLLVSCQDACTGTVSLTTELGRKTVSIGGRTV